MGKYILLCIFFSIGLMCFGQKSEDFFISLQKTSPKGSLVISQDTRLADIVKMHIRANDKNKGVDGFRIQLFLGSDDNAKKEANEVKTKFLSLLPDQAVYIMYDAPFWRVQAGDFRGKGESLVMLNKLKDIFPGCYTIPAKHVDYNNFNKPNILLKSTDAKFWQEEKEVKNKL